MSDLRRRLAKVTNIVGARGCPTCERWSLRRHAVTGKMKPGPANGLANLARAIVATQQAGELEERLAELEARVDLSEWGSA